MIRPTALLEEQSRILIAAWIVGYAEDELAWYRGPMRTTEGTVLSVLMAGTEARSIRVSRVLYRAGSMRAAFDDLYVERAFLAMCRPWGEA